MVPSLIAHHCPWRWNSRLTERATSLNCARKSGNVPRIEDYVEGVPVAGRSRLLEELLVVEFELRQDESQPLDVDSYRRRFPGRDAVIDSALALRERRKQEDPPPTADPSPARDSDEDRDPLPQQIGRFQIRRRLGKGGFGVVFLAHDPGLDRLVALKVPRSELLATGQQRESFLHEARTAAQLKHAALVTVYDVQQDGDLIYIVQEYIEGQNLSQWAAAQPRSWEDIARRLIEIATAIGYVHQQGFYHRDLKPGNILIDNEGHAHVADFGLAVHEDALRMLKGKASGTPQYMSPEQVRGETHWIDKRTDNRPFLIGAIAAAPAEECDNIATALANDREATLQDLQNAAATATSKQDWKLKTRLGTVALYLNDPSIAAEMLRGDPLLPVVNVNWYDAVMFCNWLSRQEGREPCYTKEENEEIRENDNKIREYDAWKLDPSANGYRLPTEDEWEYACRARTTTAFSFGNAEDLLDRYALFVKNAKNGPDQVGRKLCNAWGLFDMHGNVGEWCQDWYAEGSDRVGRGASWFGPASFCQSALGDGNQPNSHNDGLGFRVATVPSGK